MEDKNKVKILKLKSEIFDFKKSLNSEKYSTARMCRPGNTCAHLMRCDVQWAYIQHMETISGHKNDVVEAPCSGLLNTNSGPFAQTSGERGACHFLCERALI